jgi:MFS family permease
VAGGLVTTAHPGPAAVVTTVAALLGVAASLPPAVVACVAAAVATGQLTIGWVNDLVDLPRDRAAGRRDKPLASGRVTRAQVLAAVALAGVACLVLSLSAGWRSGLVHLFLGVGAGQAYNLGLKATAFSWVPYVVAFGTLPAVASLAGLCGACPVPASSGKTSRHRLNRGGHRQANAALHRILVVRMRFHQLTIAYVERRSREGRTTKEILRCLKRHLVREIHRALVAPHQ